MTNYPYAHRDVNARILAIGALLEQADPEGLRLSIDNDRRDVWRILRVF